MTITKETVNNKILTNESEATNNPTLAEMPWTLAEDDSTLGQPGSHITKETKNDKTITNEAEHT